MRILLVMLGLFFTNAASADWYYYVMKIACEKEKLRIINYSAFNELGKARGQEKGAIDVDTLSTWRRTDNDLKVPDKPLPYVQVCKIPSGKYQVTLTNAGGGYTAPYPVVHVVEISNPAKPKILIDHLELAEIVNIKQEIVFSRNHPNGLIINE